MKQTGKDEVMTLDEAKRRRDEFMARYGNFLTADINKSPLHKFPERIYASRDVVEAIEEAFQHWPMRDEFGEEYVGNCCFRDPRITEDHVLFKGIPVIWDGENSGHHGHAEDVTGWIFDV